MDIVHRPDRPQVTIGLAQDQRSQLPVGLSIQPGNTNDQTHFNITYRQFKPDLSKTWEADEQMINCKGKYVWSWNVMDKDTRFLIANMVSKERKITDARKMFKKAKENAKGKTPDKVITDGLQSYKDAVKKEFHSHRKTGAKHERLRTIQDKVNNNIIERYHGNWRERDKVMRGLEDMENSQELLENYRTYYNFLRRHQGLENITPAQMAGIHLNLDRNRTFDLLKRSLSVGCNKQ